MTQFASSSTSSDISVSTFSQNGVAAGSYSDVSIDSSGNVVIDYSNGVNVTYYEIAIATFVAKDNLQAVSGNAYRATAASGSATYSAAGTAGAGTISVSSLESSNVDIATEFTNLIKTQQVYSANAKALTTADSMMQTLIQLQG
jgi:flagellar hook protein FlgE